MLSSVLHSTVAIKVNINIMRAFVSIRQYVLASDTKNQEIDELRQRIQELESQGSKAFAMINQIGEETLEAINDLSEDTRKELDSIYLALSELADKEKTESLWSIFAKSQKNQPGAVAVVSTGAPHGSMSQLKEPDGAQFFKPSGTY